MLQLDNSGARPAEIFGKDLLLVFGLVFVADARRLELTSGDEGCRAADVEVLGVDGDAQRPPPAAQFGRDGQADDAAADHGDRRPAHLPFEPLHMVGDNAGAAEAERNSGAAMAIVVNQDLGSVPAWYDVIVELEADPALAVRPNADEVRVGRSQQRKIRVG